MNAAVNIRVLAGRDNMHFSRGIRLVFFSRDPDTKKQYEGHVEFTEHDPSTAISHFLPLEDEAGQALMDGLWDCGLRPTEGSGSAGAMLACQENLKDLRSINERLLAMLSAEGSATLWRVQALVESVMDVEKTRLTQRVD